MYAPQFKKVEIYPHDQDNYARLVESFIVQKCYSTKERKLSEYNLGDSCDIVVN